jgi:hypothetical protein
MKEYSKFSGSITPALNDLIHNSYSRHHRNVLKSSTRPVETAANDPDVTDVTKFA